MPGAVVTASETSMGPGPSCDLVAARAWPARCSWVKLAVVVGGGGADRAGRGQDRDVLIGRAAGAAQVGEAEAVDLASRRRRSRRPPGPCWASVSGLHWIMPKGRSAPGNSPTVPGLTGPVPVPSSGWTRAAGSVTEAAWRVAAEAAAGPEASGPVLGRP